MRKTNRALGVIAILAAIFALAGCADQGDMQQLNQNEFTLRGMIAADRQQIDALKAQVAQQNDQIQELQHNATPDSGGNASGMNDRVASLEAEVKALQAGLAATPGAVPPPGAPADSVGPGTGEAPPEAPAAAPAPPATPAEIAPTWPTELDQELADSATADDPGIKIYRDGLDAMKAAKYPLAVARFTKLQHAYPKSPLSEPAEYFAANALFETGGYDQAILQFNDLVMRFPKGKYACAALLREGQAFVKLNDRIDARLTLQKLGTDCPGTPQAASADTMMKDLASD
ncbi:MAG: outer membrane protein assembly factor BamD [Candidatus Binatus sp.]|uniref:outer membrane protein assembly factor BamD n=3 Tax=Candidatus Binatus sp. TaxID=2811406 RepID=UPI003C787FF6